MQFARAAAAGDISARSFEHCRGDAEVGDESCLLHCTKAIVATEKENQNGPLESLVKEENGNY